jgi:hypothetical protein
METQKRLTQIKFEAPQISQRLLMLLRSHSGRHIGICVCGMNAHVSKWESQVRVTTQPHQQVGSVLGTTTKKYLLEQY